MQEFNGVQSGHPSKERNPEAFPTLSDEQVRKIAEVGDHRLFSDGDDVWKIGLPMTSFFVVVRGAVEVFQISGTGDEHQVVVHQPGEFTGDIDLLSSSATVVGARAHGETETIEVPADRLRRLVVENSELSDIILAAFLARRQELLAAGRGSLTIVGSRFSPDTFRIREFLERNSRPFDWIDLESDSRVSRLLESLGVEPEETPVVIDSNGVVTHNPTVEQMAECFGLSRIDEGQIYDVIVVGAGPAGLAAAVYAASEGLSVLIVDAVAPGGQASTSSKIENYLGFPTGISGRELAQRAFVQATKFGAEVAAPREVAGLDVSARPYVLDTGGGQSARGRTIVIATGARYRRLPLANAGDFEGRGVYFGATHLEARMCSQQDVVIVGGGNSAGQAAVFLSQHARHVYVAIRSGSLEHSMSKYLIHRIDASPAITLLPHTEITGLYGDEALEAIELTDNRGGQSRRIDARHAFIFIGATPNTGWLPPDVALDSRGFVRTGRDLEAGDLAPEAWRSTRQPFLLETNVPGVFAAGDVRSGSTKRVASAVGEGSISVSFIHQFLAESGG
jgi:thioredoxin reductase (NADPH)